MDKKKEQTVRETDKEQKPVFTGDYMHDSTVTAGEAAVEVSMAIYNKMKEMKQKRNER